MGRSTTTASILVICCFLMLSVSLCLSSKAKSLLVVCCCWSVFQASFMFGTISLSLGKKKAFAKRLLSSSHPTQLSGKKQALPKLSFISLGKIFLCQRWKKLEKTDQAEDQGRTHQTHVGIQQTNWNQQTEKNKRARQEEELEKDFLLERRTLMLQCHCKSYKLEFLPSTPSVATTLLTSFPLIMILLSAMFKEKIQDLVNLVEKVLLSVCEQVIFGDDGKSKKI